MNHVDLTPYPFPPGMVIPRLMPEQDKPFNGDGYLAAEVLRLKEEHGLEYAIETGTCLGSTAMWLSDSFDFVWTFEVNEDYWTIASARIGVADNVRPILSDSVTGLARMLANFHAPFLLWADAHWGQHCPLLEELEAIAAAKVKPCIVIHDFQVPGTDFGFDRFPDSGYPFCLEAIAPHLDAIYGTGKWGHRYPEKVEGACRGWISIFPQ